jgi:trehalose 6-phosphate synthase/phosphatase
MFAVFAGGEFKSWESRTEEREVITKGETQSVVDKAKLSSDDGSDDTATNFTPHAFATGKTASSRASQSRAAASADKPDESSALYLVGYHLPVILKKSEKGWSAEWSKDSLIARSEESVAEDMQVFWVGTVSTSMAGGSEGKMSAADQAELIALLSSMNCIPIFLDAELSRQCFNGYCKSVIYPTMHNIDILNIVCAPWNLESFGANEAGEGEGASLAVWDQSQLEHFGVLWQAYQEVNAMFSRTLCERCKTGDSIWIHNYQLMLLPKFISEHFVRLEVPRPKMVFFFHCPFPTSEIFRALQTGTLLLQGVLCADVVGFHVFDHARHFLTACKRYLGLSVQSKQGGNLCVDNGGRSVMVTICHVSIDTAKLIQHTTDPIVQSKAAELQV